MYPQWLVNRVRDSETQLITQTSKDEDSNFGENWKNISEKMKISRKVSQVLPVGKWGQQFHPGAASCQETLSSHPEQRCWVGSKTSQHGLELRENHPMMQTGWSKDPMQNSNPTMEGWALRPQTLLWTEPGWTRHNSERCLRDDGNHKEGHTKTLLPHRDLILH